MLDTEEARDFLNVFSLPNIRKNFVVEELEHLPIPENLEKPIYEEKEGEWQNYFTSGNYIIQGYFAYYWLVVKDPYSYAVYAF